MTWPWTSTAATRGSGGTEPGAGFLPTTAVFPAAGGARWLGRGLAGGTPGRCAAWRPWRSTTSPTTQNSIGFRVDRTGIPVLVKASYFPNWQVDGGAGPYRVAPNFMVVVPDETRVTLSYGWTPVDVLAWVINRHRRDRRADAVAQPARLDRRGRPARPVGVTKVRRSPRRRPGSSRRRSGGAPAPDSIRDRDP